MSDFPGHQREASFEGVALTVALTVVAPRGRKGCLAIEVLHDSRPAICALRPYPDRIEVSVPREITGRGIESRRIAPVVVVKGPNHDPVEVPCLDASVETCAV